MHPNNYELKIERRQSARSVTGEKHPNTSRDVNTENNPDIINELPSDSMLTRESTQVNGAVKKQNITEDIVSAYGKNLKTNFLHDALHKSRGNVKARGKGGVYYGYQGQRLNKLHLTAAQRVAVDFSERLAKNWSK